MTSKIKKNIFLLIIAVLMLGGVIIFRITGKTLSDIEKIPIIKKFDGKIVYTINMDFDQTLLQQDCQRREGTFKQCGSICEPGVSVCAEVCAYTCEQILVDEDKMIRLDSPTTGATIASPLQVTGQARGQWYFEAEFPVILTDWDGKIIAENFARAQEEWMTEDFVPFKAKLEFESPYKFGDPDFMQKGSLILQKTNSSGLSKNDDALEIQVLFAPTGTDMNNKSK